MRKPFVLCWLATLSILCASSADAGVKGSRFEGTFTANPGGASFGVKLDFRNDNTLTVAQSVSNVPQDAFTGTYTEFDLFFISFWSSDIGNVHLTGVGFFGFATTMGYTSIPNPAATGSGSAMRTGNAVRHADSALRAGGAIGQP